MTIVQIGRATIDGVMTALVAVDGRVVRLDGVLPNMDSIGAGRLDGIFAAWNEVAPRLARLTIDADYALSMPPPNAFAAPFEHPPHLICIGANYYDHIAEMKSSVPDRPYAFLKPLTTIAPPAGPVTLPAMSAMVDWEAELGVVIGRTARHVAAADALGYIAGYLPLNDVSARDWIENAPSFGIDWVMQKGHDGFTPLGGWMTLATSVPDPQALPIHCRINGELVQDSSTANMVFTVAEVIAHLSAIMTLSPGDIIATGTPAGVGFGRSPRRFITDVDTVEVSLGILGDLKTRFTAV